jgi:hypothetical protein
MKTSILFQRAEAFALLLLSIYLYELTGYNWLIFIGLWLAIDVSMVGYLVNKRVGAIVYNIAHSFISPATLFVIGHATNTEPLVALAYIFLAHIGLDRTLGYGLKESDGFQHTHLGIIGKTTKH